MGGVICFIITSSPLEDPISDLINLISLSDNAALEGLITDMDKKGNSLINSDSNLFFGINFKILRDFDISALQKS